jgi:uncharacterized protein YlxW (UPF0749 family)
MTLTFSTNEIGIIITGVILFILFIVFFVYIMTKGSSEKQNTKKISINDAYNNLQKMKQSNKKTNQAYQLFAEETKKMFFKN